MGVINQLLFDTLSQIYIKKNFAVYYTVIREVYLRNCLSFCWDIFVAILYFPGITKP